MAKIIANTYIQQKPATRDVPVEKVRHNSPTYHDVAQQTD